MGASQVALVVKSPPANAGDVRSKGSIPGSGRSPGGGRGSPPQYSGLENPMGRGAWQFTVRGVAKSQTQLSDLTRTQARKGLCHLMGWSLKVIIAREPMVQVTY